MKVVYSLSPLLVNLVRTECGGSWGIKWELTGSIYMNIYITLRRGHKVINKVRQG